MLYLTSYYPHKNIEIINQVIPLLESEFSGKFVIVLTLHDEIFSTVINRKVAKSVINLGPVKPEECPGLYQACDFTFVPTLLECFSATYAESMAMERPILTSDMDFARTVCENAALYFDPMNPKDIVQKIKTLSNDTILKKNLIIAGNSRFKALFSASERAKKYIELCKIWKS